MQCGQCGSENETGARACHACGHVFTFEADASAGHEPGAAEAEEACMKAAIGPSATRYYMRQFTRFANGFGLSSWHWPAFLFTLPWLLYRKMWLHALVYLLFPLSVMVSAFALLRDSSAEALPMANTVTVAYGAVAWVLVPIFANALYYQFIRGKIRKSARFSTNFEHRLRYLQEKGGTSNAYMIGILACILPPIAAIIAVAIPAYGMAQIRGQVESGLVLAEDIKQAVEATILADGLLPYDRSDAGLDPDPPKPFARYVSSIEITSGRVDVLFGNEADQAISGKSVSITPYIDARAVDGWTIVWRCGYARVPPSATTAPVAYSAGSIDPQYLPDRCRERQSR